MSAEDRIRLQHMLDAAHEAILFAQRRTPEDLAADRLLLLALVKEIEIIGEAAARISPESRLTMPQIPWADIIGMRNRLIHAYADVNHDVVWSTLISDLPALVHLLEPIVGSEGPI